MNRFGQYDEYAMLEGPSILSTGWSSQAGGETSAATFGREGFKLAPLRSAEGPYAPLSSLAKNAPIVHSQCAYHPDRWGSCAALAVPAGQPEQPCCWRCQCCGPTDGCRRYR